MKLNSPTRRWIGWATAKRFADEGARIVIVDLDAQAAEQAARMIGPQHLGLACDQSACITGVVLDVSGGGCTSTDHAGCQKHAPDTASPRCP